jgi:tRNA(Ile)-lysidine synthetase-like protein
MMNVVVAVSGGVDSVVLLDILATGQLTVSSVTVAHFDHGMRETSAADARFVKALAEKYGVKYVSKREELKGCSEDEARRRRYEFLFQVAHEHQATLVTAHHLDDVVETVALNLARGTQWRGLAGMSHPEIWRPLTNRTKSELRAYAAERRLEWVEDETNQTDAYTRNRMRKKLASLSPVDKRKIYDLWQNQRVLRREIEEEITRGSLPIHSRYFMIMVEESVAITILYQYMLTKCGVSLLSSQLNRLLFAIKTARPGTLWQIGGGIEIEMSKLKWRIKSQPKVIK